MAAHEGKQRGIRGAFRKLFGRALGTQRRERERSVAAPDLSWDDEDHLAPRTNEDQLVDPWEIEASEESPRCLPPCANAAKDEPPRLSHTEPKPPRTSEADTTASDNRVGAGDRGELGPEFVEAGRPDADFWGGIAEALDATDDQEWEVLEEAEDDLIAAQRETGDPADQDGMRDTLPEAELEAAEDLGPELDREIPEVVAVEEWHNLGAGILESEWDTSSDWEDNPDLLGLAEQDQSEQHSDLGLFDYDDEAQQAPWDLEPDDDDAQIRRARARAATIANLLEVRSIAQRDGALHYLSDLFVHLHHAATYRAILSLAEDGLDPETLQAMVELRRVWMQRPDWWVGRFRGEVCMLRHGAAAFTWKLAHRVCVARSDFPPEDMIDERWMDEWLVLPPGTPGYLSFPEFISEKVGSLDAEALYAGLHLMEYSNGSGEVADERGWHRGASDRHAALRHYFRTPTPHDDRPGVIRPGPHQRNDEKEEA